MTPARQAGLIPEALDADQRALYDSITGGPRGQGPQLFPLVDNSGALEGPFNAMLLSPPVGSALQALGSAVRFRSRLTDRAREIAILVVAQHWRSEFEIYAHSAIAGAAGLDDTELGWLRDGQPDAFVDDAERVVARTAAALASNGDLTDSEYQTALESMGARTLFEVTTLVGYYAMLALQLRVYRVSPPTVQSD
jgi:4-carboxymuconolactone decarboxylase